MKARKSFRTLTKAHHRSPVGPLFVSSLRLGSMIIRMTLRGVSRRVVSRFVTPSTSPHSRRLSTLAIAGLRHRTIGSPVFYTSSLNLNSADNNPTTTQYKTDCRPLVTAVFDRPAL